MNTNIKRKSNVFFSQDRNQIRKFFQETWRKQQDGLPLQPLEAMIADIVAMHPEYHAHLEKNDLDQDYRPETGQTNPFLHMGMHIALREQLSTNMPHGITALHQQLLNRIKDPHETEHRMMDCLAEALWQAQRNNTAPDESQYLACIKNLINT